MSGLETNPGGKGHANKTQKIVFCPLLNFACFEWPLVACLTLYITSFSYVSVFEKYIFPVPSVSLRDNTCPKKASQKEPKSTQRYHWEAQRALHSLIVAPGFPSTIVWATTGPRWRPMAPPEPCEGPLSPARAPKILQTFPKSLDLYAKSEIFKN